MKRKLADAQAALPRYLESLLGGESARHAGARERPAGSFECLAFSVWGLMLAVRRMDVHNVVTDPSLLRRIGKTMQSRQPDVTGLLGVFECGRDRIKVIDVAEIAIPSAVRAELAGARGAPAAVVQVQNGRIGIVCDDSPATVTVAPEEMCWATPPNPRPWLAGVIARRRALLQVAALCASLTEARPARRFAPRAR